MPNERQTILLRMNNIDNQLLIFYREKGKFGCLWCGDVEKIIESNRTQAKESSEKWENNIKKQSVETKANDGINLRGTEYLTNEENDN